FGTAFRHHQYCAKRHRGDQQQHGCANDAVYASGEIRGHHCNLTALMLSEPVMVWLRSPRLARAGARLMPLTSNAGRAADRSTSTWSSASIGPETSSPTRISSKPS